MKGDVVFELYPDLAPKTVAAFKKYADDGLYDKTAFFRVAKFAGKGVLLGGDPWTKEEKYCYVDEVRVDLSAEAFQRLHTALTHPAPSCCNCWGYEDEGTSRGDIDSLRSLEKGP